jgi:hypothetical protein
VTGRVLLVQDDQGNQLAIGPVRTDRSLDQLRREVTSLGWAVLAAVPHYSRADFTGTNGRGIGPRLAPLPGPPSSPKPKPCSPPWPPCRPPEETRDERQPDEQ